jgi:hypothetical protein
MIAITRYKTWLEELRKDIYIYYLKKYFTAHWTVVTIETNTFITANKEYMSTSCDAGEGYNFF